MLQLLISLLIVTLLVGGYFVYRRYQPDMQRSVWVHDWLSDPAAHQDWALHAGERCGNAPFILPTSGFAGYLWDDSFRLGHRHQGIDIFGGDSPGKTPVVAAYSGYLTRLPEWKSSLIIRIPDDPFYPGRQIWIYYTHLADPQGNSFILPDFYPGSRDVYVESGTLLGYQGDYSGDPSNPVGVHLHFSIVLDEQGRFRNELEIRNTLDPSRYLGLPLNAKKNQVVIPVCGGG
jgi:hypothetical protein